MSRSLDSSYTDTLATTANTHAPSCKVEIEYAASWHDVSANVLAVSVTQTMEGRADEAQITLANPDRLYSLLWCNQADPPADVGHRVRVSMTNAPADLIQVFLGYIVQASNTVKRGDPEVVTLRCMDAGRKAWLNEITMTPKLGRAQPTGGGGGYRTSAATRQINALVTDILEQTAVGFTAGEIDLAALDYVVSAWKPGTFNPMADIGQLLGVKHYYLRFNWEGKAVSGPIIPTAASSWTYGALHANPLLVSFEERWQEPESMASIANVIAHELAAVPELAATPTLIWEGDCIHLNADPEIGPIEHYIGEWGSGQLCEFYFTASPTPEAYGGLYIAQPAGEGFWEHCDLVAYQGMREAPYAEQSIIRAYWHGSPDADNGGAVQVWGYLRQAQGAEYSGTATNTTLAAAGYEGVIEEQNDYASADADCEYLAQRLANECYPATLVVPCNLVHEPGDLITVNLDKYGGAAALAVDYIIVSHKIDYERGKPNLSTLELVRDTTHG
ncbi:MAG TPA: hypothetical protein VM221_09290 [Armatimonadota bacterium]|nr:hypothetical protein [Armatimonadota bacterium]